MPRPKMSDRVRLILAFRPPVHERLKRLLVLSGAENLTEVIRRSLAVYETLLQSVAGGCAIVIRMADGAERELVLCPEEVTGS